MGEVYGFAEKAAVAEERAQETWLLEGYTKAFPSMVALHTVHHHERHAWAQLSGRDRVVVLENGKTITVDEKILENDWPHIALEVWSDMARKKTWMDRQGARLRLCSLRVSAESECLPFAVSGAASCMV